MMRDVCYSTPGGLGSLDLISHMISGLLTLSPIIPHPLEQENRQEGVKLRYSDLIEVFFLFLCLGYSI